MRSWLRLAVASLALLGSGCSWLWPTVVRTSPREPLFHSGFPLVGSARLDGALCSLATVGPEATLLVAPPERMEGAVSVEEACREELPVGPGQRGRVARLVQVGTELGPAYGYLFTVPAPAGMLIAFTGLGMPPAGWVNARFAELAARHGLLTFAPVRDESARPISFDPLREARRALEAAARIRAACQADGPTDLRFVGVSMGGLEALLANREAHRRGMASRAAALDPLLDPARAADHLDSFWHSVAADSMQAYFRRILSGRYGEPDSTSFTDVLSRAASGPGAATDLAVDAPSAWLCAARRGDYAVFISADDPVLGDSQADFLRACEFPYRHSGASGHVPLGCRLELFDEMLDAVRPRPTQELRGQVPALSNLEAG